MNRHRSLFAVALLTTLCSVVALDRSLAAESNEIQPAILPTITLSEVLVAGEQPGPGLWKISKGDHVLWLFGTYSPLPKKMTWRSQEVEAILAGSQELITPVDVKVHVGFFGAIAILPSMIGYRNNPGNAKLSELVPADLYARWLVQKEKYIGRDLSIEKWRPTFVASELFNEAVDSWGFKKPSFPPKDELREQIERLAKKQKIKITHPTLDIEIQTPRAWVKSFKTLPLDDLACFSTTLERVEADREPMRRRVNAWAIGDIASIRPPSYVNQADPCITVFFAILNSNAAREHGFDNILANIVKKWVDATETALARNTSTFAILSIDNIFWKDGYIAALREKGYSIEEP